MKSASEKFPEKFKVMDLQYTAYESTESLKRRVIPYKKLVVPIRMRSIYWKYFGFPAAEDGSIITKDKIVCILCKNQMIYNRNTSNLRMHLTSKHKTIMAKIDPTAIIPLPKSKGKKAKNESHSTPVDGDYDFSGMGVMGLHKKTETKELQVVVSEEGNDPDISNIAIIFPNDVDYNEGKNTEETMESNEITDLIVNFIITDLIGPDFVNGKGFHCLMSNVSNKAVLIPNEKKLVNDILPNLFNSCKEQLFSSMQMNTLNNLALSIEEWTCADGVNCISIYLHYSQNIDASLCCKLLRTIALTGTETMSHWSTVLDHILQEWNLNVNYVTAVIVSFINDDLLKAIKAKNLIAVPCFLFVIQQFCDNHCFQDERVATVLSKCRKLVKYLQDNHIELRVEMVDSTDDENDDDIEYNLCLDIQGLWLSTFFMIRSLTRKRSVIDEAVLNLDSEFINIVPDESEWQTIIELVTLMEPLKVIVITLFEEKNSLISLLKPLIWKVNTSKFEASKDDSMLMSEMKEYIRNTLNAAYSEQDVHNLTQIASILDPRFKHFVRQNGDEDIEGILIELLTNFVNVEGSSSPSQVCGNASDQTPNKRSNRLSGINSLLGNICSRKQPAMTLEDKIKMEVTHYQSESSALLEECPLDWWHRLNNKCPNLSRLAYRYHCVPAIITRTGNQSVNDYLKFHQKRSVLNVNVADVLLFLHSNKNL